jgi:hypothetical protein
MPEKLTEEKSMQSVIQPWLAQHCTMKMQSVLILSLRGHDGMEKEEPSKIITRALRSVIFIDADIAAGAKSSKFTHHELTTQRLKAFTEDLDHYSVHWLTHVMHPAEIIGYKHPNTEIAHFWQIVYMSIVEALHLLPESIEHLNIRLADKPFGDVERHAYRSLPTNIRLISIVEPVKTIIPPRQSDGHRTGYRG